MDAQKIRARDAAVARLRRVTTAAAGVAGVLALVVTGIAAKAFPGRSSHAATAPTTTTTRVAGRRSATQTPPPLVSNGSPAPTPSAPATPSAPTPTAAPPVAVSGGS